MHLKGAMDPPVTRDTIHTMAPMRTMEAMDSMELLDGIFGIPRDP